jgi:RNA polymerase sigma factor for flagellar operon FliA
MSLHLRRDTTIDKNLEVRQIVELLPLVHNITRQVVTYLKPPLSFEDMVSAGTVGLVKAAHDFDPSRQAKFKTYVYIRIRGAILDEMRNWSFLPATLSKRIRNMQRVSWKISEQTGVAPTDAELSEKLGITVEELYARFRKPRAQHFVSIDGFGGDSPVLGDLLEAAHASDPDEKTERAELLDKLVEAVQQLVERQRQIILLYYGQRLTMKKIAEFLEITETRVSQLHASALFNLSVELSEWKDSRL